MSSFHDFNFHPELQSGLDAMGYKTPTPIQQQAIPAVMAGKDLIACAQTGTGKTAAYLLPILNKIKTAGTTSINTLVIAPTRELALQIDQQIEALGYFSGVSSLAVYGGGDGVAWEQQKRALQMGADIIIATPGRLISMLSQHTLDLSGFQHLILDEADRMLDMGFHDDIMRIISYLPKERQTLLFSATMPPKIRSLASKILLNPEQINIAISKPAEGILQQAYLVYNPHKLELLKSILKDTHYQSIIVFCSTKENVKKLYNELRKTKITVRSFHSDLEQKEREEIMQDFKNRKLQMIVGTDILSRGIDVEGIDLVVNYDVPPDAEDYIHRIGRTARAASTGTAITFINDIDQMRFHRIEELMERQVQKVALPEHLPPGPEYQPKRRPAHMGMPGKKRPSHPKKSFNRKQPPGHHTPKG
ncbi:MAG: DEAD/DEAH box helicase [Chitinophagales bacterium]